ncbi:DUF4105 domain-containing protein [Thiomicrorhabdus sp.]|uniref:DUF7840 domain-containing protein n=1 Tax=Thiomicrorhabdus sp. TaxID=2039724 RepID=UPI0029C690C7|nr:DUF4105 domain-containing protein [Thiomicrorhabdus sp.]
MSFHKLGLKQAFYLLVFSMVWSSPSLSKASELYDSLEWKALIHYENGGFLFLDNRFLLSMPNPSPKAELEQTLAAMSSNGNLDDSHVMCRFPARARWLAEKLQLDLSALPKPECKAYQETIGKIPTGKIELMVPEANTARFDEAFSHAAIIFREDDGSDDNAYMTYLKIIPDDDTRVDHTFDFLASSTVIDVLPYSEYVSFYLNERSRNVYLYDIKSSTQDRLIIRDHLWELNDIYKRYSPYTWNCSNSVRTLLAIKNPQLLNYSGIWDTPTDLARDVSRDGMVSKTDAVQSLDWRIELAAEKIPDSELDKIEQYDNDYSLLPPEGFNADEVALLQALNERKHADKTLSDSEFEVNLNWLKRQATYQEQSSKTLDDFELPSNDSQISLGWRSDPSQYTFSFLAAGHRVRDSLGSYLSQQITQLMDLQLNYDVDSQKLNIEHFTAYQYQTFVPWNRFTQRYSEQLAFGIKKLYTNVPLTQKAMYAEAARGITVQLKDRVAAFGFLKVGAGWESNQKHFEAYLTPQIGLILDQGNGWRTNVLVEYTTFYDHDESLVKAKLTQGIRLGPDYSAFVELSHEEQGNAEDQSVELSLTRYF